jgi:hypothetical protein
MIRELSADTMPAAMAVILPSIEGRFARSGWWIGGRWLGSLAAIAAGGYHQLRSGLKAGVCRRLQMASIQMKRLLASTFYLTLLASPSQRLTD